MTTPPSSLLTLPDELLLHILDHIDGFAHPWRIRSLYGLSLANQRLHGISKPFVYSTFSFHSAVPYKFLRTICLNADLASQVKVIRWDYDTSESEKFCYEPGKLGVRHHWYFADALEKLEITASQGNLTASKLMHQLKPGPLYLGHQTALELLLMFTPNVELLEVVETYRWDDYTFWFQPILCRYNDFSQLTSATVQGPMRAKNVVLLIFLPALQYLKLNQVIQMREEMGQALRLAKSWGDFKLGPGVSDPPSSNLKHLHMLESYDGLENFAHLGRYIRNLKSFVYEHERNDLSRQHLDFPDQNLIQILKHQRLSLTSIRIADSYTSLPYNLPSAVSIPASEGILFETIRDCPNLTQLELFLPLAQSRHRAPKWESLPQNLEHLTIEHHSAHNYLENRVDTSELESSLKGLAVRKRRGELPEMRQLTFKNWHPFYGTFPQDTSIKDVLREVGIEFISMPATIGSTMATMDDIGWVELQTEPEWVLIERYRMED